MFAINNCKKINDINKNSNITKEKQQRGKLSRARAELNTTPSWFDYIVNSIYG